MWSSKNAPLEGVLGNMVIQFEASAQPQPPNKYFTPADTHACLFAAVTAPLTAVAAVLQLQNEIRSNLDDLRVIKAELRGAAQLPSAITRSSHPGSESAESRPNPV